MSYRHRGPDLYVARVGFSFPKSDVHFASDCSDIGAATPVWYDA